MIAVADDRVGAPSSLSCGIPDCHDDALRGLRRWSVPELPAGSARCVSVRSCCSAEILLEFPDASRGVLELDAVPDWPGLARELGSARPLAVLVGRAGGVPDASILVSSGSGAVRMRTTEGIALACLEAGIHGVFRFEGCDEVGA